MLWFGRPSPTVIHRKLAVVPCSAAFTRASCWEMGCECGGVSYTRVFPNKDRLEQFQLGPAYEAYKNGEVHIPSKWRGSAPITDWMNSCCPTHEPKWTHDELWKEHTIMLAFFYGISTALLALFLYFRNEQPLKFRDYRSMIVFWLMLNVEMTLAVIMGNTGGTGPTVIHLIVPFSMPSTILAYYIVKSVQVYFIYAWNQAKLSKRSYEKIKLFHAFRFVLDYRAYFVTLAVLLLFTCAVPVIYGMTARPIFADAEHENAYNSLRCEWWQIPEEYQQPKSDSKLCACIQYATALPGGSLEECVQAVFSVCGPGGEAPEEMGFCATCMTDFLSQSIGSECTNWLGAFYLEGNCGHPAQVPNSPTCKTGIFADEYLAAVGASISYFLWGVNVAVLIPLIGKQDDFGLILENILTNVVVTVALFFVFAGILGDHGTIFKWYFDGLKQDYRPVPLFTWIGSFWAMLMTMGFPLCLVAWRKWAPYVLQAQAQEQGTDPSHTSREINTSLAATDAGEMLDEGERGIESCVRHPALREIYGKFAAEAFHVENIRFLEDCAALLDHISREITTTTMHEIAESAEAIYSQYITTDSPLEINITSRRRTEIKTNLHAFLDRAQPSTPSTPAGDEFAAEVELVAASSWTEGAASDDKGRTMPELDAMATSFAAAYTDIRRLLSRDCWPRFKVSRFYQAYRTLIKEEAELTHAVSGMGMSERQPTRRRTLGLTQSSPKLSSTASERDNEWALSSEAILSELESERSML